MGLNVGKLAGSAVSGVPVVGDIAGALGGIISGLESHPDDKSRRLPANAKAFSLALAGDGNALKFLGQRGKLLPGAYLTEPAVLDEVPGIIGPWATETARADAAGKYQQVYAAAQAGGGGAATATGPTGNTPATAAADALKAEAFAGLPLWAVLGLVAGMVYYLAKPPGGR